MVKVKWDNYVGRPEMEYWVKLSGTEGVFLMKCEWNELVEGWTLLPFIVKVNRESGKMRLLFEDGGNN